MKTHHTYLEYISFLFEDKLKDSLFCLIRDEKQYSYHLKDIEKCSIVEKEQHSSVVKAFINDFKSYLTNNTPLNFIYGNNVDIYYHFSQSIFHHIIHEDPFNTLDFSVEKPTVQELLKIGQLFKEGTIRLDTIFDRVKDAIDVDVEKYKDFLLFMATIPNHHLFLKNLIPMNTIKSEVGTFTRVFQNETDSKVKDAFITYLENRKDFIVKIDSKPFEEYLLYRIKKGFAPKYWSEFMFALPNLKEKELEVVKDDLIEFSNEKMYHLNINKGALYKLCPSILNDQELSRVVESITKVIDANKPAEVNMVHYYSMLNDIKIMFSGNIDESYLHKFSNLYQKMFGEYNSDNVVKFSMDGDDRAIALLNNVKYLNKAAETHWMDVMLEPSSNKKNKKIKM